MINDWDGEETLDCPCSSRVYKVTFWHHVCLEKLSGEGVSKFMPNNDNNSQKGWNSLTFISRCHVINIISPVSYGLPSVSVLNWIDQYRAKNYCYTQAIVDSKNESNRGCGMIHFWDFFGWSFRQKFSTWYIARQKSWTWTHSVIQIYVAFQKIQKHLFNFYFSQETRVKQN